MRSLFIGASLLALMAPTAYAQQAPSPTAPMPKAAPAEAAKYLVFFEWDKATLTPEARKVIASAADEYKKTGSTRIVAAGYTDLSGSPQYNLKLSERRADAVKAELVRLGVPVTVITTIGKGEEDPLVSTKDGVREAQNRRVEIVIPRPSKPVEAPKPVVAAPPPPPPPPAPKWAATLGPWYGYNIKERDKEGGENQRSSHLIGPDVRIEYALTPTWSIFAEGVGFNTVGTSVDDGWGGRGVGGFTYQWNLGAWHAFIGPHFGYIGGKGVEDGALIGPEVGVSYDIADKWFLYGRAGYDHNFRNGFNQGIVNGGIGAGTRW